MCWSKADKLHYAVVTCYSIMPLDVIGAHSTCRFTQCEQALLIAYYKFDNELVCYHGMFGITWMLLTLGACARVTVVVVCVCLCVCVLSFPC